MSESDRRIEPLFFKNADVEQAEGNHLTTLEICEAVAEVVVSEVKHYMVSLLWEHGHRELRMSQTNLKTAIEMLPSVMHCNKN